MGYQFEEADELSFHHLLIPSRLCGSRGMDKGYYEWNGVMLVQHTSHEFLHIIEKYDLDRFYAITSEMLDEKMKGHISLENIKVIDDILYSFEKEYAGETFNGSGKPVIKEAYTKRLMR